MSTTLMVPRFSHHSHSFSLRPHHETSYALLLFVVLGLGMILGSFSMAAESAATGGGSYKVEAVVPGPRPKIAPVITSPSNGQAFSTNPVTVDGTCPSKTLVKIFTNNILVGSILCGANGRFSLPIDLVIGKNDLTAIAYNTADEAGPTSNTVTVTLNQPPGGPGFSTELVIQSQSYYRGQLPGTEVEWPVDIIGGLSPYAVSFDWGDGTTDLITRLAPGPFIVKHTYKLPGKGYLGSYPIIIRATDTAGHHAYLQLVTIVNDSFATTSSAKAPESPLNRLIVIWPIWIVIILMIISFWLGERREKKIMNRQLEALA